MKNLFSTPPKAKVPLLFFMLLCVFVFTINNAHAQNLVWGYALGGTQNDQCNSIATDAAGNVYSTGYYQAPSNDFDPGAGTLALPNFGNFEIYVYKADASGNLLWAKGLGGTGLDRGNGIAVDASGNVVVCGSFTGTVDFDPGAGVTNLVSAGGTDAFVLKLDANGNFIWATRIGSLSSDVGNDVDLDANGNVYYTGTYGAGAATDFDPGAGTYNLTALSYDNAYVSKLNSNGTFAWAVTVDGTNINRGVSIKTSGTDVVVGGVFNTTADFDPNGVYNLSPASTGLKPWVWKITQSTGALVWAETFGGTSTTNDELRDLDVDAAGNIFTTGYFRATCDFDPGATTNPLTAASTFSGFIQKLNSAGAFVWAGQFASNNTSGCFSVDVDANQNVLVCGNHIGTTDLDIGSDTFKVSTTDVYSSVFYVKMNNNGALLSGGTLNESYSGAAGIAIAGSTNGSMVLGGYFDYLLDVDPTSILTQISNPDPAYTHIFLAKIDSCFTPEFAASPAKIYSCAGSVASLSLTGSILTNTYQIYKNGVAVGSSQQGTGNALMFNVNTFSNNDSLTIVATHGACSKIMQGKAYIVSGNLPVDSGLLRHYRLDNSGVDETGGASATFNAGAFAADRFSNANFSRNIGAANQGVNIPALSSDNITISFWMNPAFVGAGADAMLLMSSSYNNANTYHLRMLTNTLVVGNLGVVGNSGAVLTAGAWHHIVYVKNGVNVKVYVNGSLVITCTNAPSIASFPITSFGNGQSSYLGGPIDDIRVYNYNFTEAQALLAYTAPNVWAPVTAISQCLGTAVSIKDSVQSNAGVTFQWYKNGVAVNGATNQTLNIAGLTFADTGSYKLVVTKGCLNAESKATRVNVSGGQINIPNLNAWFKFDNSAADSSGNANHGINNGAIGTTNRFGTINGAFDFGSPKFVSVPAALFSAPASKTVTMWFKKRTATSRGCLFYMGSAAPPAAPPSNSHPMIYLGQDDKLRGVIYTGNSNQNASTFTITDTTWHMLALVTGTNNQTLYFDGVLASTLTGTFSVTSISSLLIGVGKDYGWGSGTVSNVWDYFDGKIDEVRFYNASLSLAEINTIYTSETGFTSHPVSQSVCAGSPVTFAVTAQGNITYQWQKDGNNLPGATAASYTNANAQAGDAGSYACVITNACNGVSQTSNAATLTLGSGAIISSQPQNQAPCFGSTANFAVVVTGGSATYQWKKNGLNIPGATSAAYNIAPTTISDTGAYVCVITGSCGVQNSDTAMLTILPATNITTQPVATAVCAGAGANFSVAATGAGTLTYVWQKGITVLGNGANISGATTTALNVSGVGIADVANYSVAVTGACGSAISVDAALSITPATSISTQPVTQTTCSGSAVTFVVVGSGANLFYQWEKSAVTINGATSPSFTIAAASVADTGSYTVEVTGSCGSVTSSTAGLTIVSAASISQQPVAQTVCVGSTINLSVVGSGGNNSTYQWRKGGNTINGGNTASYNIPSAVTGDAGNYDVVISGSCGTVTSNAVVVTVNPNPVTTISGNTTICNGSSTTLAANGGGTYAWSSGGGNSSAASFSPTASTTYTVTVTTNNCTATASTSVTVNQLPVAGIIPAGPVSICDGTSTTLTATGGTTYAWSNGGGNNATATFSPTATGPYTVTVTQNGCSVTTTKSVTVNALPAAVISPAAASICNGASQALTAAGGATYAWSNGLGSAANQSVSPGHTTTYTVSVTDINNCSATAVAAITVNTVTASINGPTTICSGLSATLTAAGGTDYLWSDNSVTAAITVSPVSAATYTVTVIGVGGCTATVSQTVSVQNTPTATITGASALCAGNSVSLTANGGNTYAWSNGLGTNATVNVSPTTTTTYTVTASLGANCSASASQTISVLQPSASSFDETICNGETLFFDGNTLSASGTYMRVIPNSAGCDSIITLNLTVLSPIVTSASYTMCAGNSYDFNGVTLTQPGIYYDTLTAAQGCDSLVTLNLTIGAVTVITTEPAATTTICSGNALELNVTATGDNLSYQWLKDGAIINGANAVNLTISAALVSDAGIYKLTVNGSCGTDTSTDATVVVHASPEPVVQQTGSVLTSSVAGSAYQWYLDGVAVNNATSQSYTATQTGNYKVEVTSAHGCGGTSAELNVVISGIGHTARAYISIYPNPATSCLLISCDEQIETVEVYNVTGEQVIFVNGQTASLNIAKLAQGLYAIKIKTTQGKSDVNRFTKE